MGCPRFSTKKPWNSRLIMIYLSWLYMLYNASSLVSESASCSRIQVWAGSRSVASVFALMVKNSGLLISDKPWSIVRLKGKSKVVPEHSRSILNAQATFHAELSGLKLVGSQAPTFLHSCFFCYGLLWFSRHLCHTGGPKLSLMLWKRNLLNRRHNTGAATGGSFWILPCTRGIYFPRRQESRCNE